MRVSVLLVTCMHLYLVSGDCFNEAPNNKSYSNCASCYQTFASALVNTGDNRYRLGRAFFPIHSAPPIQVEVTYKNILETESSVWFWLKGGFFIFQPIHLLLYRSLYFSPPIYRRQSLTLILPDECFDNSSNETLTEFFEFATSRLRGYARSQSETLDIDETYLGKPVNDEMNEIQYFLDDGTKIVIAAYGLPFMVCLVIVSLVFISVLCASFERTARVIKGSTLMQANIIAGMLLCVLITLYTIIFDIRTWHAERIHFDTPSYYAKEKQFVDMTNTFFIIYLLCFLIGVIWCITEMIIFGSTNFLCGRNTSESPSDNSSSIALKSSSLTSGDIESNPTDDLSKLGGVIRKCGVGRDLKWCWKGFKTGYFPRRKRITCSCVMIAGSMILALSAHFPSILIAWATDPFYASKVVLFYGLNIAVFFTVFHYDYIFLVKVLCKQRKFNKTACITIPISLLVCALFVTGVSFIITVFVISVPINNSIETTADGVTSIYNGAVIFIGGLLAYKIGWHYIGHSFSVSGALHEVMKRTDTPPFGVNNNYEWDKITEEGRLSLIMEAMLKSKDLRATVEK